MTEKELLKIMSLINHPDYVVMWIGSHGYRVLENHINREDDELKVSFQEDNVDYIDLYNTNFDELKVYKEVKLS